MDCSEQNVHVLVFGSVRCRDGNFLRNGTVSGKRRGNGKFNETLSFVSFVRDV